MNCASVLLDDAILEGHGARIALYSQSGNWSYFELLERANRIANVLVRDLGVVPGNRVLLRGANSPILAGELARRDEGGRDRGHDHADAASQGARRHGRAGADRLRDLRSAPRRRAA